MPHRLVLFAFLTSTFGAASLRAQSVLFVDDDAASGGDGSSWSSAFRDLQDALAAANGGGVDEIWVAAGTYRPDGGTGDRDLAFVLPPDVHLIGGFSGDESDRSQRDPTVHVTTLSGDLAGDDGAGFANIGENSFHVLEAGASSAEQRIDGFVVRGGNAEGTPVANKRGAALYAVGAKLGIVRCTFEANRSGGRGGAIHADASELAISHSTFRGNRAGTDGGAIRAEASAVSIFGCELVANESVGEGGALVTVDSELDLNVVRFDTNVAGTHGGGARISLTEGNEDKRIDVTDCEFTDNVCQHRGGALQAVVAGGTVWIVDSSFFRNRSIGFGQSQGGGVDLFFSTAGAAQSVAIVRTCEFVENEVHNDGGALHLEEVDDGEIRDCSFIDNDAWQGGAIAELGNEAILHERCSFSGNRAQFGGALYSVNGRTTRVAGCVFERNAAGDSFGAVFASNQLIVASCTIAGNAAANVIGGVGVGSTSSVLTHSILSDNADSSGEGQAAQLSGFLGASWCCIEGWDGSLGGTNSFDADPRFVDAGTGDVRLASDSPCIDVGDAAFGASSIPIDLGWNSRLTDGDLDRELRIDLGALEFSHVYVAASASTTPGGQVTIDTEGTAGLPVLLIFGIDTRLLLVPHVGYLGVELGSICACLPWPPAPSSVTLDVPSDAPTDDVWVQQIAFSGAAANFSNLVKIEVR